VEPLAVSPEAIERARAFARASRSDATLEAYASDWRDFTAWCDTHQTSPLPAAPAAVAIYLSDLAHQGAKVSTIERRLSTIGQAHHVQGLPSPKGHADVQAVVMGIRRKLGVKQKQAKPLLPADLRRIVAALPDGAQGARDRALLLLGFSGAFRRAELVSLDVGDLAFGAEGLTVTLRRSKTDQEGAGRQVAVPHGEHEATCPLRAVRAWLAAAKRATGHRLDGALFRPIDRHGNVGTSRLTPHAVRLVIRRAMVQAGLDPTGYSAHSLRAGFVTAAVRGGATRIAIQRQTGHKSLAMVVRYVREASLFRDNAASKTGL
jgi:site-specific recombinase XerD